MTLLPLASGQISPQALAVAHIDRAFVFLVHSEDCVQSGRRIQREKTWSSARRRVTLSLP